MRLREHIPNVLTVSRLPLTAIMLWFHIKGFPWSAVVVGVIASLTDRYDGLLARRWNCESTFGKNLDPYADKFFCWTLTCMVVLTWYESAYFEFVLIPVIVMIALYDIGIAIIRHIWGSVHIPTNQFAKWKTTCLMVGLIGFYLANLLDSATKRIGVPDLLSDISSVLLWIGGILAFCSALIYLRAYLKPTA